MFQEQLEEENEEDDNSEDKDNINQEKIKDAMEIDIIEKVRKSYLVS